MAGVEATTPMQINLDEFVRKAVSRIGGDWPEMDIQLILAHVLGKSRSWLLAHPKIQLNPQQAAELEAEIEQLELGEPLPYIIGQWEFFGLEFEVNREVLIPRPETELMVEQAIVLLQSKPGQTRAADIGTGSGCISAAIAAHVPELNMLATDISFPALQVARRNAIKHEVADRIHFVQCDLLPMRSPDATGIPRFNVVCANLPYIPTKKLINLPVFGREPTVALDGGESGLDLIQRLFAIIPAWLAPGGTLFMEIEASLGFKATALAYDAFNDARIRLHSDLSGHDRLLEINLNHRLQ